MAGPGPFSERLKSFSLRDRQTQLILASISCVLIVILALIALPGGNKKGALTGSNNNSSSDSGVTSGAGPTTSSSSSGASGSGPLGGTSDGSVSVAPSNPSGLTQAQIKKLPPITSTTVKIGMTYLSDPGTANAAAGFGGIGQVDQRRGFDMIIKAINKNPPLGLKIVPVYYSQSTAQVESKGSERIDQEACDAFTKDNRVFMSFDGFLAGGTATFHDCMKKAGIPEIGYPTAPTRETFKQYPDLVDEAGVAFDRLAEFEVDQLYAANYFSQFKPVPTGYTPLKPVNGKPLIGLIRYDTPGHIAAAKAMKARLAAHGLSLCSGCEWSVSYSDSNVQEQLDDATEVNAAIQAAKAKGVTHMLFLGSTAGCRITLFFTQGAEQQHYRPRLGLNPADCAQLVADQFGSSTYPQFQDSIYITGDPADFGQTTPANATCIKMWEAAGEDFSGNSGTNKKAQAPVWCDLMWYYEAAMGRASKPLTAAQWMHGVESVPPVQSASTYVMQTKPGRHDGLGAVRRGGWDDGCHCYKPISPVVPV
jgi:hypothetical protein